MAFVVVRSHHAVSVSAADASRAAHLYQELLLRIHRFRDRYDLKRPLAPWFYQIANNVVADDFRHMGRNRQTVLEMDYISSAELGGEQTLCGRQQARQLLDLIPVERAAVLIAAKVQGHDYAEIARHTGRPVDAVEQVHTTHFVVSGQQMFSQLDWLWKTTFPPQSSQTKPVSRVDRRHQEVTQ